MELWLQGRVLKPNHSNKSRRKKYLTSLSLLVSYSLSGVSYWASPPCLLGRRGWWGGRAAGGKGKQRASSTFFLFLPTSVQLLPRAQTPSCLLHAISLLKCPPGFSPSEVGSLSRHASQPFQTPPSPQVDYRLLKGRTCSSFFGSSRVNLTGLRTCLLKEKVIWFQGLSPWRGTELESAAWKESRGHSLGVPV